MIKQAMEVACYGKNDMGVFLTFKPDRSNYCFFTRDDALTKIKSRVTLPFTHSVDFEAKEEIENLYSAKMLRQISALPRCQSVELKMYEEGSLVVQVNINNETVIKHLLSPLEREV
jgi:hypothetical protein